MPKSKQIIGENLPSVGIIIRTKDRPLFVRRALATVAAQSYTNWQIIIVNDGGKINDLDDAVSEAVKSTYIDTSKISVEHLKRNIGRSAAFNYGLERLKTDFIACLDDDDTWDPYFLEKLIGFHEDIKDRIPDLGGVSSHVTAILEDLVEATPTNPSRELVILGEDALPVSFNRNDLFVQHLAYSCYRQDVYPVQWILHREKVAEIGGFPESFDVMEDRAMLLKLLSKYRLAVLDEKLAYHHRRKARSDDKARTVEMNTLDNQSYQWRIFADLADYDAESMNAHANNPDALGPLMFRLHQQLLREVNAETSALWHRLNDLHHNLRSRSEGDQFLPTDVLDTNDIRYDIFKDNAEVLQGYGLNIGDTFLDRFALSAHDNQEGILYWTNSYEREITVQIPDTQKWMALEFNLDGLVDPARPFRLELALQIESTQLFETGLSTWHSENDNNIHSFEEVHVHRGREGTIRNIARTFTRHAELGNRTGLKFSIIAPKMMKNYLFTIKDLRIIQSA